MCKKLVKNSKKDSLDDASPCDGGSILPVKFAVKFLIDHACHGGGTEKPPTLSHDGGITVFGDDHVLQKGDADGFQRTLHGLGNVQIRARGDGHASRMIVSQYHRGGVVAKGLLRDATLVIPAP